MTAFPSPATHDAAEPRLAGAAPASQELPVVNVVAFLLIVVSVIPVYLAQRIGGEAVGIGR